MSLAPALVSTTQLAERLAGGAAPLVLDASFDLADPAAGERRFVAEHVAGSHYVHLDRDLCGPKTGNNGRHPLPDRADFARTAGRLGIGPDTDVVALDAQGGMYAARLWWMLRWLGHERVSVLDGGLAAWRTAGAALSSGAVPAAAPLPPYPERPRQVETVGAPGVAGRAPAMAVLDARSPDRFRGENETLDPVGGHIPGALNRFFKNNLAEDGRFKPAETLRAEFGAVLGGRAPAEVIHSCGSGVTACHNLLAMAHAGLDGALLYPGSWSEWSSDPARPIER